MNWKKAIMASAGAGAAYFVTSIDTSSGEDEGDLSNIAVTTDGDDNIYATFQGVDDGDNVRRATTFKLQPSGDIVASLASDRSGSSVSTQQRFSSLKNYHDGNGNFIYSFRDQNDRTHIRSVADTLSTSSENYEKALRKNSTYQTDGRAVYFDDNNNVFLTNYDGSRTELMKFAESNLNYSDGIRYAHNNFQSQLQPDFLADGGGITTDSSGNIFVAGSHAHFGYRASIYKFNSSINHQWGRTMYNGSSASRSHCCACDSSGNVYVGVQFASPGDEALLVKFNTSGTHQWSRVLKCNSNGGRWIDMHIDGDDNIYVSGVIFEDFSGGDFAGRQRITTLAKYNTSGTLQWERGFRYTSTTTGFSVTDNNSAVTTDSTGAIILAMHECSSSSGSTNHTLRIWRIPADGTLMGTYSGGTDGTVQYGETNRAANSGSATQPTISNMTLNVESSYFGTVDMPNQTLNHEVPNFSSDTTTSVLS